MTKATIHKILTILIALVWLANGLLCKVLNLVPRHQQIVGRILGETHAGLLTKLIGVSEILMAVWIISGIKSRLNAMAQMIIIGLMNCIEFVLAPDLLLWGKANSVFAFIFIALIYYNEFKLRKKLVI
jgi:uncharacterized membrane protein YphA (DoxX/SURF4 family)